MFVPHASEISTESYGPNYIKFCELFDKKTGFFKTIFDKALAPFWKTFLQLEQFLNAKLLISRLPSSSVPKITVVGHLQPG